MTLSLSLAIALPILFMTALMQFARLERRYVIPVVVCLLAGGLTYIPAGYINGWVLAETSTTLTVISVTLAPIAEEILKALPVSDVRMLVAMPVEITISLGRRIRRPKL